MKHLLFLFTLLALSTSQGCSDGITGDTPSCLSDEIDLFQTDPNICEEDAKVDKYILENKEIFVFYRGLCITDDTQRVVDSTCLELGFVGGLLGLSDLTIGDFKDAVYVETVWSN